MNRPFIISINSVSGGGKTALATALHRSLPQSALFCFDDFDDSNVYPEDFYEWSRRGTDITEFDCPGMRNAVDEEIQRRKAKQIILDYPFGRRHPRFADIIDLAVFIDTPLDVALARRILRDYSVGNQKVLAEVLENLRSELTHYLAKARHPYLDTYKDKEVSDLILDGYRCLDDLKSEVLARMGFGTEVETLA
ncbi:MAG: AAA family ATPase [Gemmatimonadetes bacterium]|nr:AAA family ATPase [Gemmatimonadota bacterium]